MQGVKLKKVVDRRYVSLQGGLSLFTSFFSVPKGDNDIRMVYDASKSGLNEVIWVPRFPLPTINTHLRAVEPGTWMGDLDIGDMFLNFPLHESLQKLCGVDLTHYGELVFPHLVASVPDWSLRKPYLWSFGWSRCAMGLKSSPYQTIRGAMVAEEMILGDPDNPENVFRWAMVRLNLPGMEGYDP